MSKVDASEFTGSNCFEVFLQRTDSLGVLCDTKNLHQSLMLLWVGYR